MHTVGQILSLYKPEEAPLNVKQPRQLTPAEELSPGCQSFQPTSNSGLKLRVLGCSLGQVMGLLFASTALLNVRSRAVLSLWHSRVLSPGLKQPEEFGPRVLIPSFSPEEAHGTAPVVQRGWAGLLPVSRSGLWPWSLQCTQLRSGSRVMGPSCSSCGETGTSPG